VQRDGQPELRDLRLVSSPFCTTSRVPVHNYREGLHNMRNIWWLLGFPWGHPHLPWDVSPRGETAPVTSPVSTIPSLSVPALHELRRIYCKHLLEVFATSETQELYERGCITGTFTSVSQARGSFVVEGVTSIGIAVLESVERP
jgi:hypothetical protein